MKIKTEATVHDLYDVPDHGKAEIIKGELVCMAPTGGVLGRAGGEIFISLRENMKNVQTQGMHCLIMWGLLWIYLIENHSVLMQLFIQDS